MDVTQILDITRVIKDQCKHYMVTYGVTPQEINDGMCGDFADDLEDIGFGRPVWGDELVEHAELHWSPEVLALGYWLEFHVAGHCFTMFNGRFYDSECPQGCDYVDELPFYQRELKQYFS